MKSLSGCAEVVNFLQSQSLQTSKLHVLVRLAEEQFMEWVSYAEQLRLSLTLRDVTPLDCRAVET